MGNPDYPAGLSLVSVLVHDYDEAIRFFVEGLGFAVVEDVPSTTNDGRPKRWVVVRPPFGTAGILLAKADPGRQAQAIGNQFGGRVGLFLRVPNFDEHYASMKAFGVTFTTEPRDEPYGRIAVFRDIYGNLWDLLGPH